MRFEKVIRFKDSVINLPERKTIGAAGYDFEVAEDIVIPSYQKLCEKLTSDIMATNPASLEDMALLVKVTKAKPTLVPTGVKCYLDEGYYLELSVRSSCPLKYWLILANGVGIIDRDYADNPDNDGEIFFQMINLSPYDIQLHKGDIIGQGIIKKYYTTEDDAAAGVRTGGFGSTSMEKPNV